MNVGEFHRLLQTHPDAALQFQLPSGEFIPDHFHVTEVGRVEKHFIDCGGTRRQASSCLLQTWTAHDREHRLRAGKLAHIIELAAPVLGSRELPLEVEHGEQLAAQYVVAGVAVRLDSLLVTLAGKRTNCLAPDKCSGCCR